MLTLPGNWGNILSANWLIPEEEQTLMLTYQRDGFCFFEKDIPASETWQKTYLVFKMIYLNFKERKELKILSFLLNPHSPTPSPKQKPRHLSPQLFHPVPPATPGRVSLTWRLSVCPFPYSHEESLQLKHEQHQALCGHLWRPEGNPFLLLLPAFAHAKVLRWRGSAWTGSAVDVTRSERTAWGQTASALTCCGRTLDFIWVQ